MANTDDRIEQFRKMTEADPQNELGHFSLGKALLEAGRAGDAIPSLEQAIALNANISKAYQLLGDALMKSGKREAGLERLTAGFKVADARGDAMTRTDIGRMLSEAGAPVPASAAPTNAAPSIAGEGQVQCRRCGRIAKKLAKPPFKGPFGQQIFDSVCADCWREAIGMGTKVINELRLPMNDPQAQKVWDQHIREFLNLT